MVLSEGSRMLGEDHKFKSASEPCAKKEFTGLNFGMFKELFNVYPIRQSLLTSLSAIDVASLLQVIGAEYDIGSHERAKYLNPMRDLFTDEELLKLQQDMAEMEDHHIVIWGTDLEEFLRRTPDTRAGPDGGKLDLWMAQVSTKRADWLDFEIEQEEWYGNIDYSSRNMRGARQPRIEIPGDWSLLAGQTKLKRRRQERTDDVRLHLQQPTESANTPDDLLWVIQRWQIVPPKIPIVLDMPPELEERYPWELLMLGNKSLHYMTTKDMKTFRIKTVQRLDHPQNFYPPRGTDGVNLCCPGGGKVLVTWDMTWHHYGRWKTQSVPPDTVSDARYYFVFSLQDGSNDERLVETFGLHTTTP